MILLIIIVEVIILFEIYHKKKNLYMIKDSGKIPDIQYLKFLIVLLWIIFIFFPFIVYELI